MSKFCPNCGTQTDDATVFCAMCGTSFETYQTPGEPAAPARPAAAIDPELFKKICAGVLAAMLIFTVVIAILSFTGAYDVTVKASAGGFNSSQSGPLNELWEADDYALFMVVCMVYAVANLALAAIAGLGVKNALSGKYDLLQKFGIAGAATNVIYMILFKLTGTLSSTVFGVKISASIAIPAFVWIAAILFAGIAAFAIVGKKKNLY